jgi:rifampicin phosphotransferase
MSRAALAVAACDTESRLLCALADARDERDVGGKALNLARLMGLQLPVPDGEVLTREAFGLFLADADLEHRLDEDVRTASSCALEDLTAVERRARTLIESAALPPQIEAALTHVASRWLSNGSVVVRSSAVGEDGVQSSFAGQFDSVLGVTSLAGLRDAVRACYASYWSARALFYRRTRQLQSAGMAIVLQQQLQPVAAGVLFTRNPDSHSGSHDTIAIEYCAGLADRLVGGAVDPGRVVVSRATGAILTHDSTAVGVTVRDAVTRCVGELVRMALLIEERLGSPQDIEWALDAAGRVWVVQSRPITTGATHRPTADTTDVLWTNANVSENFPQPISPLLYSIASLGYYHYFRNLGLAFGVSRRRLAAMDRPLRGIIGVHGARMYYNLTNIHAVLRMAPFGDRLTVAFNTFVGAHEATQSPSGMVTWRDRRARLSQWGELARIVISTAWQYTFFKSRIRAFERTADTFAQRTRRECLQSASLETLGALLAEFIDIRCQRWKNASLADAAAMVTYALLEQVLSAGGCGAGVHTRLLRALPGVPSSMPPRRLWSLSRDIRRDPELQLLFRHADPSRVLAVIRSDPRFGAFLRQFATFLETWGFRSSAELMLTVPALDERPEPVIELLKQYALDDGDSPDLAIARQAAERRRDTSTVLRTLRRRSPLRAALAWLLIRWTQRSIAYRERARFKQALLYTRCRRVALQIGERLVSRGQLVSRDDVFMLTCAELEELTAGRGMFARGIGGLVALRKQLHSRESEVTPPDAFRLPAGEVFSGGVEAIPPSDAGQLEASPGTVLSGTSACGGRVSGRAAVLRDVSEAGRLTRGNVLVTCQTDPGWGPVFCLISGLVIERGGMLSHGAIIAREFGLPCVVGVKDATRRISHGAAITVDGDRGRCVLEAES